MLRIELQKLKHRAGRKDEGEQNRAAAIIAD